MYLICIFFSTWDHICWEKKIDHTQPLACTDKAQLHKSKNSLKTVMLELLSDCNISDRKILCIVGINT